MLKRDNMVYLIPPSNFASCLAVGAQWLFSADLFSHGHPLSASQPGDSHMTKPAATFMQLLGLLGVLWGIGEQSWVISGIGIGLLIWGGAAVRKRIEADS